MTRRRPRRRTRRVLPLTIAVLAIVLGGATLVPAASYSTGDVSRGTAVGVTDDPQGLIALDTATGVRIGHTDRLVVVTNNLDSAATVTVSLHDGSATFAELVVDGTRTGDSHTVELDPAASVGIDVEIPDDGSLVGDDIVFDTSADSAALDAVLRDRRAPIEDSSQ